MVWMDSRSVLGAGKSQAFHWKTLNAASHIPNRIAQMSRRLRLPMISVRFLGVNTIDLVLTVVVTTPEFLAKHPDVVKKVLGVHATWTQRLQDDPQKYVGPLGDALFAINQKRLPEGVLPAAFKNVEFTLDPLDETFQIMGQWAHDLGFAAAPPKLDGLVDTKLLAEVRNQPTQATTAPTTAPVASR